MSPSEPTWAEILARPNMHQPVPAGWVSISALTKLQECNYYLSQDGTNDAARRGTALHAIMAGDEMPDDIPELDRAAVEEAHHKLEELCYKYGVVSEEMEMPMINSAMRIRGTCDYYAKCLDGWHMVVDFKFGRGRISSDALQLKGYSSCIVDKHDAHVVMAIIQPGSPVESKVSTIGACNSAVWECLQADRKEPGKICKYCARNGSCPEFLRYQSK